MFSNIDHLKKNMQEKTELSLANIINIIFFSIFDICKNNPTSEWQQILQEYDSEIEKQNNIGWPSIVIINNDYLKRVDSIMSKSFIASTNILTMLTRLRFIENYKKSHSKNIYSHPIDKLVIKNQDNIKITKISITDFFSYLKHGLMDFCCIYDQNSIEYNISQAIINQI